LPLLTILVHTHFSVRCFAIYEFNADIHNVISDAAFNSHHFPQLCANNKKNNNKTFVEHPSAIAPEVLAEQVSKLYAVLNK